MEIMEDSKSFEILRNAFEQQLINDGFVEHSGYSLEKNHINAYIDERVECAWFACLQGYRLAKTQAVPEWISVEDGLPSDGQNIIAFDAIKHCVFKDGEFLQGYFEPDTGHEYTEPVDVTHWIAIEPQEPAND